MAMQWHDLLFLHWPVSIAALRPLIPSGLTLDTFEGRAWIGVVPFTMAGVHARYLPPLHFASRLDVVAWLPTVVDAAV